MTKTDKEVKMFSLLCLIISIICIFIYTHTVHGDDYNVARSVIMSRDLIGLDFEQCYDKLYTENWFNADVKLWSKQGKIHKMFKDIDYSYCTSFYACSAIDGHDGRCKEYLYKLYFNENEKVVYAELVPEKAA